MSNSVDSANALPAASTRILAMLGKLQAWLPTNDGVFTLDNPGNPQDPMCGLLFLCIESQLPDHIVAKPIMLAGIVVTPLLIPKAKYRFSEGTSAMRALGLTEDVTREIKRRHSAHKSVLNA